MANLGRLFVEKFAGFGDKPALVGIDGTLSYRALVEAAVTIEQALRRAGLSADEPVMVPASNEPRDAAALMGVWLAGGVAAPVARSAPEAAVAAVRAATGARFSVTNTTDTLVSTLAEKAPRHRPLLAGAALIVFTSGSTGRPKGVVLSHDAFAQKLEAIDSMLGFTPDTRTLLVLQITFVFGMWLMLLTLMRGGTTWMHAQFDARRVLAALREQRISDVAMVPTMLRKLMAAEEAATPVAGNIAAARILTGGEPFGRELSARLKAFMPQARVVDIFGLTETCSSDFFLTAEDRLQFAETIGRAGPRIEFRIADDQGRELPSGSAGELQIRTPFVMNGYLDEPELTRAAFIDGYFRTGDLARKRADGRVELAGRIKDLINRGGAKVAPLELDHVLSEYPGVAAALTAGIPDPVVGERIHALIVPRADAHIDEKELRAWLAQRIERYKRPDAYHFGQELPTGRTGKVDRNALRDLVQKSAAAQTDGEKALRR